MTIEQTLLRDIEESQKALNGPNEDTIIDEIIRKELN